MHAGNDAFMSKIKHDFVLLRENTTYLWIIRYLSVDVVHKYWNSIKMEEANIS